MGDDAFIFATLDNTADAICLDIRRLIDGILEHSNNAAFSMAPCFLFDGLLLLHAPCGLLSGSVSPEAGEVLLRHD
jgi:hypothetical protein